VRPSTRLLSIAVIAALASCSGARVRAPEAPAYERRELSIPMRDGVTLFAVAIVPKAPAEPLPILLIRTPYSAEGTIPKAEPPRGYGELARDGYIFVAEDIRGRFRSGGEFVMLRAQDDPRSPRGINESTDAYDTIDWLVKHLPENNGKVGVLGVSYPGWLAGLAGVGPHPALKAISPQAPTTDVWLGDDFFHQGAFRQTQGLEFSALMETDPKGFNFVELPEHDHYAFYRRYPTLDSLAAATGVTRLPTWSAFVAHPAYDAFWRARAMEHVLTSAEVPILFVGGWWDQEDMLGPQLGYRAVERSDTASRSRIVLGPWFHGGWERTSGDSLGPLAFGSRTSEFFRDSIERPWFAHYLHGRGDGRFPEAWAFETGENRWHAFDAWPPKEARPRELYLRENGALSFGAPPASLRGGAIYDGWISDPAHPIPYTPRPDDGEGWRTWLEEDQRFVDGRPDVATWQTAPLAEDLVIGGDVAAQLFASTSGTDADWVVKLIDVYPDTVPEAPRMGGYELMVNADIMRGRYWKGFDRATPIPANVPTPFTVDLHGQLYRFRKGHRLMVQIQSSWFPLYDRNPQTFVPNIFRAKASDYRAQEHRVWHSARYPSHLTLPVLP
jgi:putative CocE/NonD family hydrolase